MKSDHQKNLLSGFSLTEVVIALGLVVFALVALFGLLSSGLNISRDSKSEMFSAQMVSTLLAERRSLPTNDQLASPILPLNVSSGGLQTRFLDRNGEVVSRDLAYAGLAFEIEPLDSSTARLYVAVAQPPPKEATHAAYASAREHFEVTTYVRLH